MRSLYNYQISKKSNCGAIIYVNVWQKPDGEFYVKLTKHKVRSSFFKPILIGDTNSYGHKLIDSIRQYIELTYIEK